eukprot:scaffold305391_cov17-Tisochrysis_lutea.AAC.1
MAFGCTVFLVFEGKREKERVQQSRLTPSGTFSVVPACTLVLKRQAVAWWLGIQDKWGLKMGVGVGVDDLSTLDLSVVDEWPIAPQGLSRCVLRPQKVSRCVLKPQLSFRRCVLKPQQTDASASSHHTHPRWNFTCMRRPVCISLSKFMPST